MSHFSKLNFSEYRELMPSLVDMLDTGVLSWNNSNQICLNTTISEPSNYALGCGSLTYDWNKSYNITHAGISKTVIPERQVPLKDEDFTCMCSQFINTPFEHVYNMLSSTYTLGRVRLMRLNSKICTTWHTDTSKRIHYPIKTQRGCIMVIGDESMHMPQDTWWMTDTCVAHAAFNGSLESRIHLVAGLVNK